jgi:hypothetical protein
MQDQLVSIEVGSLSEVVGGERCKRVRPGDWEAFPKGAGRGTMHTGAIVFAGTRQGCRGAIRGL